MRSVVKKHLRLQSRPWQWLVSLFAFGVYVFLFRRLYFDLGDSAALVGVVLSGLIGILLGAGGGLVMSTGFILANMFLFRTIMNAPLQIAMAYWPQQLAILIIGVGSGWLHDRIFDQFHNSLRQMQLIDRLRRKTQEFDVLSELHIALAREMNTPDIVELSVEHITSKFGYRHVCFYLIERAEFVLHYQVGYDQIAERLPLSTPGLDESLKTRHVTFRENLESCDFVLNASIQPESRIIIPILDERTVYGLLIVEEPEKGRLSEHDVKFLAAVSQHIGTAFQRSRLFSAVNVLKHSIERQTLDRNLELSTANQKLAKMIGEDDELLHNVLAASASPTIDQVIQKTMEAIGAIVTFEFSGFYWADLQDQYLRPAGYDDRPTPWPEINSYAIPFGQGIVGDVALTSTPEMVNHAEEDVRSTYPPGVTPDSEHIIVLPLSARNQLKAILVIGRVFEAATPFNQDEFEVAQLLVSQAGLAIDNLQLISEIQSTLTELGSANLRLNALTDRQQQLLRVSRAVLSERSLEPLVRTLMSVAKELIGDQNAIVLYRPSETADVLVPFYVDNPAMYSELDDFNIPIGKGIAGHVVQSRQAEMVNNAHLDPRSIYPDAMELELEHLITIPLVARGRVISLVNFSRDHNPPYSEEEFELLQVFFGLAAIAMDNATLIGELEAREVDLVEHNDQLEGLIAVRTASLRHENAQRNALANMMRGAIERPDLESFFELVHEEINTVIEAENFIAILYDETTQLFSEVYFRDKYDLPGSPANLAKSIAAYVFRSGIPLLLDQAKFERLVEAGEVKLIGSRSPSWLGVPLITSNKTLGVLICQHYEIVDCYSEGDVDFLTSVAAHIALAIEKIAAEDLLAASNTHLAARSRALARSNRDLQQFARAASHDLQEQLRQVSIYSQKLLRLDGMGRNPEALENVDFISEGVDRLQALLKDLLAYTSIGMDPVQLEPVDCNQVLRIVSKQLGASIKANNAHIIIGELPWIRSDFDLLVELFSNLVKNALKFRTQQIPEIQISASREFGDGTWVFSVCDNGIGIDPAYQDRIFEIFQRLHPTDFYPGTGIGLAASKKIVEHLGGRLWLETGSDNGSTFKIALREASMETLAAIPTTGQP
jgi:K+-sensing histidine kinase KdpD